MPKPTGYEKTVALARGYGFKIKRIDDDCFVIEEPVPADALSGGYDFVQVTFDKFSPSFRFVAAQHLFWPGPGCQSHLVSELGSYAAVREVIRSLAGPSAIEEG